MKKIIFSLIILIQLLVIGITLKNISQKSVLGTTSVNLIKSQDLIYPKIDDLKYFYEPTPNSIIKPKAIFAELENVSYKINADGLNQIQNYSESKKENTFRIMTIGDSFTFGTNVNTEDNYPSQLNKLLDEKLLCPTIKKFEVINLGVFAYDIQYTVERFKFRGLKYNPDLVLWLLIPDDFKRLNELLLPKVREYTKKAKENGSYQKRVKDGVLFYEERTAKDDIIKNLGGINNVLLMQEEYINQLNTFYSGKLVISSFLNTAHAYEQVLKRFSDERENTFFYNTFPSIYHIDGATFPDTHPNKKGHKLIAENFLKYLIKKKLIPCDFK